MITGFGVAESIVHYYNIWGGNILGKKVFVNEDDAGSVIMKAREHWFQEEITENIIK